MAYSDRNFLISMTDEFMNVFLELLWDILKDGNLSHDWAYSVQYRLTLDRFTELDGESKVGLTFEKFVEIVVSEEEDLSFLWVMN